MAETASFPPRERRRLPPQALPVLAVVAVLAVVLWLVLKPHRRSDELFTGYVVSENIFMASPVAGTVATIAVRRGQSVAPGAPLFRIDPTVRAAEADRARAQITANQASVAGQQAALARARADLAAAVADAERSGAELSRLSAAQREKPGSVAQLQIDQTRATHLAALGRRDAARTQLGAAAAAIEGAQAQVTEARAGLSAAQRELDELAPTAPRAGRIDDIMFKPGETVPPNVPVVTIVPTDEIRVRFYVPQALVNGYPPGRRVVIGCDGCRQGMTAVIDFVSSRPEYTPPVIYSLDARQKLVFLVEAVPSAPLALTPGQPMDVAGALRDLPRR
ncbi:HlyD family efflux transporter periplasmic adaptor subunit [Phenylobacterium sp. LjRoot219]|uniref:HlyD family secretion protein n=1 Tax=Phenylobacterium sp. LjRoot219 TaxID=3342283 RepID=UPI003ECCB55A